MRISFTLCLLLSTFFAQSQTSTIKGQLKDSEGQPIAFANVILFAAADSAMLKVEPSDESGLFQIRAIPAGDYFVKASYVGYPDLVRENIVLKNDEIKDLGILAFGAAAIELTEATVTATRALVEVKADRTVFNVQGTINSVGENALALMRKAPGVTVDNNDNVSVLGRAGVLIYLDGKRLPLSGDELSGYLRNLTAEQIDRIDIITNPGAKYEAEGNAGIIDIRLKKDKNLGTNGSLTGTFSQGKYKSYNGTVMANHRNKKMNVFGTLGAGDNQSYHNMFFVSEQYTVHMDESVINVFGSTNLNYRLGTDFFLTDKSTFGFLASGSQNNRDNQSDNRIELSDIATPTMIDSILIANTTSDGKFTNQTYNLNYRFDNRKGRSLNFDLDYGKFLNNDERNQPNQYTDASENIMLTRIVNEFDTKSDIDIYTANVDYEEGLLGGQLGVGARYSKVVSDNDFIVFDGEGPTRVQDNESSNLFTYDESVYAAYLSYNRAINQKWNFSAGLRTELTDAVGDLTTFNDTDSTINLNYLQWFPSAGLTYQAAPSHAFSLNYGRRINRPDYSVLNPFENRLSELSYELGNPRLNPEIVNNMEIGYTYAYRYNIKLAYSKTTDQITRIIAPDDEDPRAGFITWANLAEQTIYSLNVSLPIQMTKKWSAYINLSGAHQNNQANYEEYGLNGKIDLQAWSYTIYQQHTFDLPMGFKGEISGYFSGPGIWGGVFKYDESWDLSLGLQKKFFQDKLNVRLSMSDLFYQTGWNGRSEFGGLISTGRGNWDSRRFTASASYNFGNEAVKSSNRKTGLQDEAKRVGGN
jgi:iron complex outermembrane recepter protein